jgi:CheY-like chemotaxis protein
MRKRYSRRSRLAHLKDASEGRHNDRGLRVLVVDDDPDACNILKIFFDTECGYVTEIAHNALDALVELRSASQTFDGIFLDINMPEMDGIELCELIRKNPAYRSVPIIMITGMTDQDLLRASLAAGADDFIAKPFDFEDVVTAFRKHRRAYMNNSVEIQPETTVKAHSSSGTR